MKINFHNLHNKGGQTTQSLLSYPLSHNTQSSETVKLCIQQLAIPSEKIEDSKKISAETSKIDLTTQLMPAQEFKELKKEELKMATSRCMG
jgi:hypothetical protein